jgi:hypothetical protein
MRTKAVIEFSLPDEQAEYDAMMLARARDARSFNALDRIHRIARAEINHGAATIDSLKKALEAIRELSRYEEADE